jgi:hypothetical protein
MEGLDAWLRDAVGSGIYDMRAFARGLRRNLATVRNALTTKWTTEDPEPSDEWPRQCRSSSCQTTSVARLLSAHKSRQNLSSAHATAGRPDERPAKLRLSAIYQPAYPQICPLCGV